MPAGLTAVLPELSSGELAWLATLEDVESRLILTESCGDGSHYSIEHGPFDVRRLASLPESNWTLLVQDVDKHLPVFRKLLAEAPFIPDWRIDDLMVSYATPGGGVGPHRDNYDVFLCQGAGCRHWHIAPQDAELQSVASGELSLLEPFTDPHPIRASSGDVLYLPPGVAHWGVALEPCMTYSIGMRAPTLAEFSTAMARVMELDVGTRVTAEILYADPDLAVDEWEPGRISNRALERARRCFATDTGLGDDDFATVFGCVVTEVKPWLAPETPNRADIDAFCASGTTEVRVHGMARLAYVAAAERNIVFANGEARAASHVELEWFREVCRQRSSGTETGELFHWLLAQGAFDLEPYEQVDET